MVGWVGAGALCVCRGRGKKGARVVWLYLNGEPLEVSFAREVQRLVHRLCERRIVRDARIAEEQSGVRVHGAGLTDRLRVTLSHGDESRL